ncbi:hypothetical protein [Polyangium aurulentum]|uniref:hypothetical protein n=1 Tax=Polyangium aurulentum TaxID=2567896 RepID=UPI0010ADBF77|nr:hypothetical protein [Polyangium aurulentum]UQA60848.1 hypothetical protein E8A73_010355 [Polyangium aurulentum]
MPFARALIVLLGAPAALALAGRAQAAERVALAWAAPEGCPTGADVLAEVDRLLGDDAARPKEPLAVAAIVKREGGGGYRVRLETPGASGPRVREIDAASCKTLGDTTALIIAMMIDPAAVSAASPGGANASSSDAGASPAPEGASPSGAGASPTRADDSSRLAGASPTRADDSSRLANASPTQANDSSRLANASPTQANDSSRLANASPRLVGDSPRLAHDSPRLAHASPTPAPSAQTSRPPIAIAVRALIARGSLPETSFGLSATGALYFGRLRIEAGAAIYLPERVIPYPVLPETGAELDLALGTAAACWDVRIKRRIFVAPCVGLEIGSLDAESFGVTSPGQGSALWAATGAGGRIMAVPWQRFALSFGLDAVFPIHRPTFVVPPLGAFYQPSWVAARLSIGAELRL